MSEPIYGQGRCEKHGPYTLTAEGCPTCRSEYAAVKLREAVSASRSKIERDGDKVTITTGDYRTVYSRIWWGPAATQIASLQQALVEQDARIRELEAEVERLRKHLKAIVPLAQIGSGTNEALARVKAAAEASDE